MCNNVCFSTQIEGVQPGGVVARLSLSLSSYIYKPRVCLVEYWGLNQLCFEES